MVPVSDRYVFYPPRRAGLFLHTSLLALLVFATILGLRAASQADIGLTFLVALLPLLLASVLVPVFFYYTFALQRSYYSLRRDGILLHWGLRIEEIPIDRVDWVRLAIDLNKALPLPALRLPGSVLGVRRVEGLGEVEFMASRTHGIVLVHTPQRTFALSPEDPDAFLRAYRQLSEFGSLTPLPARSLFPTFLLARLWADRLARLLLVGSLALSLALLAWVSLAVPTRSSISLGLLASGAVRDPVASVRLLLLPVLNAVLVLVDLVVGAILYRRPQNLPLAYLVWGFAVFTPLLFLGGVAFILV